MPQQQADPSNWRPPARRATVYAASSKALDSRYHEAARVLGRGLARAGIEIVYGGGSTGLMGSLADAALAAGGRVHGVIPEFLVAREAAHRDLTRLDVVADMPTRKRMLLEGSQAVLALPGGIGTFEEVFEAMSLKYLGFFHGPLMLVNVDGYFDRCLEMLRFAVAERFVSRPRRDLWQVVDDPAAVPGLLGHGEHREPAGQGERR